jgi:hypothetical protein
MRVACLCAVLESGLMTGDNAICDVVEVRGAKSEAQRKGTEGVL